MKLNQNTQYSKEAMQNRIINYITNKMCWDKSYRRFSALKKDRLTEDGKIRVTIDYLRGYDYLIINGDKDYKPPFRYRFKKVSFNGFIEFDISQINKVTVTKIEFYYFKA